MLIVILIRCVLTHSVPSGAPTAPVTRYCSTSEVFYTLSKNGSTNTPFVVYKACYGGTLCLQNDKTSCDGPNELYVNGVCKEKCSNGK